MRSMPVFLFTFPVLVRRFLVVPLLAALRRRGWGRSPQCVSVAVGNSRRSRLRFTAFSFVSALSVLFFPVGPSLSIGGRADYSCLGGRLPGRALGWTVLGGSFLSSGLSLPSPFYQLYYFHLSEKKQFDYACLFLRV